MYIDRLIYFNFSIIICSVLDNLSKDNVHQMDYIPEEHIQHNIGKYLVGCVDKATIQSYTILPIKMSNVFHHFTDP